MLLSLLAPLAIVLQNAAPAPSGASAESAPPARPNILLIVGDDLGYGELGCYGQRKIDTPRLDALAREGLRFTDFYAGAPVCAPSRCALMTGLHGGHAFVRDNFELDEGQLPIPAGTVTLPRLLQTSGYATAMIGKWGLGGPRTSGEPLEQGFDEWFGFYCQRRAQTFYPEELWRDGKRVALDGNAPDGASGTQYAEDLFMEEAERFLRRDHGKPFFLYLPFTLPHLALQPEAEDLERYRGRFDEVPYHGERGYLPHRTPRAAYAAMISRLDRDVGRLLDLLDELGLAEDTLVLFMSDNGPTFDIGGVDTKFFDSTAGLRGRKGTVYEGGLRVPLIARWKGHTPVGAVSGCVAASYDLLPTLLELSGLPPLAGIDGQSFAAELTGGSAPAHEFLLWEFHGYGGQIAVRMGRWKGVHMGLLERPRSFEL